MVKNFVTYCILNFFFGVNLRRYAPKKKSVIKTKKKLIKSILENFFIKMVAGSGIEPLTSGL